MCAKKLLHLIRVPHESTKLCSWNVIWMQNHIHQDILVWPQWWSFVDVSQQGVEFSKKISKMKIIFWFDFHRCSHGLNDFWHRKMTLKVRFRHFLTTHENIFVSQIKKYFSFTDLFDKFKPLLTHVHKTPPLRSH